MFIIKCGTAKVYKSDLSTADKLEVLIFGTVVNMIKRTIVKENVFWFEISVSNSVVMHKLDSVAQLVRHLPDLFNRIGHKVVVLKEVKD